MAGGKYYTEAEDGRIREAVEDGALTEPDFRPLALELCRPAMTVRQRAIGVGLIAPGRRPGPPAADPELEPAPKPTRGTDFAPGEDAFLLRAREKGMTQREIAFALNRTESGVYLRLSQLVARTDPPREYARAVEPDRSVQAAACAKHARACLKAGGFWALSERRVGAGKWAVCLPLIPPPARLEDAA
jgi:hypothetical protein